MKRWRKIAGAKPAIQGRSTHAETTRDLAGIFEMHCVMSVYAHGGRDCYPVNIAGGEASDCQIKLRR
jgi:hypothetical protein